MRIVLDMDEVLTRTLTRWLDLYNEDVDPEWQRTLEDIKGWNIQFWVKPDVDIYSYLALPKFYRDMQPVEGAVEGVNGLLDDGHDVVIATAVPHSAPDGFGDKLRWLEEWIPRFPRKSFVAVSRKELVQGDVLLDDGTHNLVDWPGIAVCMDRPWNRGEIDVDARFSTWDGFVRWVDMIRSDDSVRNWYETSARTRLYRYHTEGEKKHVTR